MTIDRERKIVTVREAGIRVDVFIHQACPALSRHMSARLIREGGVLINGHPAKKGQLLAEGDCVALPAQTAAAPEVIPEPDLPLEILFQNENALVVNKPAGMNMYPLKSGETGTLANALLGHFPELAGTGFSWREPGLLHRLDRETSGAVLIAKNKAAFEFFRRQFAARLVEKIYLAVVRGRPPAQGVIDLPLKKTGPRGARMAVAPPNTPAASAAQTIFKVREYHTDFAICEVTIPTGVRHQIRVHLAHLGFPIAGDKLYGLTGAETDPSPSRHLLHAWKISFTDPSGGKRITVICEPPGEFLAFWNSL